MGTIAWSKLAKLYILGLKYIHPNKINMVIRKMNTEFTAWQLAVCLYYWFKDKTELTKNEIFDSEPFLKVGTDKRTQTKYFNYMLKKGYLIDLSEQKKQQWIEEQKQKSGDKYTTEQIEQWANRKFIFSTYMINPKIEEMRPISLKQLLDQLKGQQILEAH